MDRYARLRYKSRWLRGPSHLGAAWHNYWRVKDERPFLVLRHPATSAHAHRDFFRWVQRQVPELHRRMEFRFLPLRANLDWSRYRLLVSWAGDTFRDWDPQSYQRSLEVLTACCQANVPVINPVNQVVRSKSEAARCIARTGLRVPRMIPLSNRLELRDAADQLGYPFLVREDRGHGQPTTVVGSSSELGGVALGLFRQPVAVEYVDTCDRRDSLYRKYRYLAVGDYGINRHLIVNRRWEVRPERRVCRDSTRAEELAFVQACNPHHEKLQQARQLLGLDVAGFDYSLDREGQVVVWEANAFPDLNFPKREWCHHLRETVQRSHAALAAWYLRRAGLEIPDRIRQPLDALPQRPARQPRAA